MPDAKAMSATDVDTIRDKIVGCHELAQSIREKSFKLNDREVDKNPKGEVKETANDIGQEFKERISDLHGVLSDAYSSLCAFV